MAEGGNNQQQVWDKLLELSEKTANATGKLASATTWLQITVPIVAVAIGALAIQSYNLNRSVGELTVTVTALTVSIDSLAKSHETLTHSINSLEDSQNDLTTTVGKLETGVEDLKKKL